MLNAGTQKNSLYSISAEEILNYINNLEKSDPFFWKIWFLWKNEGKWKKQIPFSAFKRLFEYNN